ncbi:MAG: hypothetical protein P8Y79_14275 [Ignavibacteriaceae bacterium]
MPPKSKYRRGYPVAILIGLENDTASIWRVYSKIVKPEKIINLEYYIKTSNAYYNFYESIINVLRPILREGVKSVLIASPKTSDHNNNFINHIANHHVWLNQEKSKIIISQITGSAKSIPEVTDLTRKPEFKKIINETVEKESDFNLNLLEKRLNKAGSEQLVLYSLDDIEKEIVYSSDRNYKPEVLLLTDKFLSRGINRSRVQRVIQIAENKGVETRIINSDIDAGKRLSQLGGIVCIRKEISRH